MSQQPWLQFKYGTSGNLPPQEIDASNIFVGDLHEMVSNISKSNPDAPEVYRDVQHRDSVYYLFYM